MQTKLDYLVSISGPPITILSQAGYSSRVTTAKVTWPPMLFVLQCFRYCNKICYCIFYLIPLFAFNTISVILRSIIIFFIANIFMIGIYILHCLYLFYSRDIAYISRLFDSSLSFTLRRRMFSSERIYRYFSICEVMGAFAPSRVMRDGN